MCTYTCALCICMYACLYIHKCICIYVHKYICTCAYMCVCVYVGVRARMFESVGSRRPVCFATLLRRAVSYAQLAARAACLHFVARLVSPPICAHPRTLCLLLQRLTIYLSASLSASTLVCWCVWCATRRRRGARWAHNTFARAKTCTWMTEASVAVTRCARPVHCRWARTQHAPGVLCMV